MLLFVLGCVVRHDLVCCCCVLLMEALFFFFQKTSICYLSFPDSNSGELLFLCYPRYYEYNQQQF